MAEMESAETIREAVGVFETAEALEEAVDDLLSSGFDRAELSLLASEATVLQKLGHVFARSESAEDDPNAPRTAFVSTESIGDAEGGLIGGLLYVGALVAAGAVVATGGTMLVAILAAAAGGGAGGLVGAGLATLIGRHHAEYLEKQLEHGGLLLWVRTKDAAHEQRATDILSKHSAHDVHVHEITAGG
jgi:hypothetical protein